MTSVSIRRPNVEPAFNELRRLSASSRVAERQIAARIRSPICTGTQLRVIGDYDIWNLSGFYTGFKNWTFSAGIKNLMDRNPPFSNQTATAATGSVGGYDPTYTDPHGRLYWVGIKYLFK